MVLRVLQSLKFIILKPYMIWRMRRKFRKHLGYRLRLKAPRTYCEKIQWLKFNHNHFDLKLIHRADKFAVREFIKQKGFEPILVKLYACFNHPSQINWDALPSSFVVKVNNSSGSKYMWRVKNKNATNFLEISKQLNMRLHGKYGYKNGETHYSLMQPKVIMEEYLQNKDGSEILDYKFYCFHGKLEFFSVEQGKFSGRHMRGYYMKDWKKTPFDFYHDVPRPVKPFEKPKNFEKMIEIAEALSQGFPHIRVDLYNMDGRICFGELTYVPENGLTRWHPASYDLHFGDKMDLTDITH